MSQGPDPAPKWSFDPLHVLLKGLEVLGYFGIGAGISAVVSGVALWAVGQMPTPTPEEDGWAIIMGTALGHGLVATAIAVPVWLVASLLRPLRWLRAWWLGLILANALSLTALVTAVMRAA